jgi:hypothetical protein
MLVGPDFFPSTRTGSGQIVLGKIEANKEGKNGKANHQIALGKE